MQVYNRRGSQNPVPECFGTVLVQLDGIEKNNNRTETRRHESHNDWNDKDERKTDLSVDVAAAALRNISDESLHRAVAKLKTAGTHYAFI